jgi:hypothetical protein
LLLICRIAKEFYIVKKSLGEGLIFLVSQPRAGSTLLQLMLSGHPEIATTSEPWIALHPIYALKSSGIRTIYDSYLARSALVDFLKQSGLNQDSYRAQVADLLMSLYKQSMDFQKKSFFLDKTPRYYLIISELIELFPKAHFLILFRNPLAILHSVLRTWVKEDLPLIGDYRNDLLDAPRMLFECSNKHCGRVFTLKYEELVVNSEKVLKDICNFLNISFAHEMLRYDDRINYDWSFGDSVGIHRSSRANTDSLDKWKNEMITVEERVCAASYLEELGSDLVNAIGYNFEELKENINILADDLKNYSQLWATLMSDIGGFPLTKEIRDVIYQILSKSPIDDNNKEFMTSENEGWSKIIRWCRRYAWKQNMNVLAGEINALRGENEALKNSLSWKLTAPGRGLVSLFKGKHRK